MPARRLESRRSNKKARRFRDALFLKHGGTRSRFARNSGLLVVHAAAGSVTMTARRSFLLLRNLGDHALGRQQEAGNRSRVLQRGARDLRRINNARLDEVLELVGRDVVANVAL